MTTQSDSLKIDVLVPATKDLSLLIQTLESISSARERFMLMGGDVNLFVQVGDRSEEMNDQLNRFVYDECVDVECVPDMQKFYAHSKSEWIAVVDVGTFWTDSILTTLAPHFSESGTLESGIFYAREDFLKVMNAQKAFSQANVQSAQAEVLSQDWVQSAPEFALISQSQKTGVNHA